MRIFPKIILFAAILIISTSCKSKQPEVQVEAEKPVSSVLQSVKSPAPTQTVLPENKNIVVTKTPSPSEITTPTPVAEKTVQQTTEAPSTEVVEGVTEPASENSHITVGTLVIPAEKPNLNEIVEGLGLSLEAQSQLLESSASPTPSTVGLNRIFKLAENEKPLYTSFLTKLDMNVFSDVEPMTVAKIFIQLGIDDKWEACFAMYEKSNISMTIDEYKQMNEEQISSVDPLIRRAIANQAFGTLSQGEFVENVDGTGFIKYLDQNGSERKFHLIKADDGIWYVKFLPFE